MIGIDGASYMVRKHNGHVIRRSNVVGVGEMTMALAGQPAGALHGNWLQSFEVLLHAAERGTRI